MKEGRDIRYSDVRDRLATDCEPEIMNAEDPLFILYTSGFDRKAEGRRPHDRRLCGLGGDDLRLDLRLPAGRHLLVHRRHRLDHRPQLRRLRPADDARDQRHVRRRPQLSRLRPLLGDGRPARRDDLLHRADGHPRAEREGDEWVTRHSRKSLRLLGTVGEPINPDAWEWYWRVVGDGRCPIVDTWWQTETGAALISPIPGAIPLKPGRRPSRFRASMPSWSMKRATPEGRGQRQSLPDRFLARADAHRMGRPPALLRDLFHDLSRDLFHRRRLPPRRGRLLLDHRPGRRCDQRLRPSRRHAPKSKARWSSHPKVAEAAVVGYPARHQGPGDLRLRDAQCRRRRRRRAPQGAEPGSAPRHRRAGRAGKDPLHPGAAQDPLGQDHAPHPAQDRRGRRPTASATPRPSPIRRSSTRCLPAGSERRSLPALRRSSPPSPAHARSILSNSSAAAHMAKARSRSSSNQPRRISRRQRRAASRRTAPCPQAGDPRARQAAADALLADAGDRPEPIRGNAHGRRGPVRVEVSGERRTNPLSRQGSSQLRPVADRGPDRREVRNEMRVRTLRHHRRPF